MAIRKTRLREIITEEVRRILSERTSRDSLPATRLERDEDIWKGAAADQKALNKLGINVKAKKSSFGGSPNWLIGTHGPHIVQIKRFNEPSQYGIKNGRISLLFIQDSKTKKILADYDRGNWAVKPTDPQVKKLVDQIIGALK